MSHKSKNPLVNPLNQYKNTCLECLKYKPRNRKTIEKCENQNHYSLTTEILIQIHKTQFKVQIKTNKKKFPQKYKF